MSWLASMNPWHHSDDSHASTVQEQYPTNTPQRTPPAVASVRPPRSLPTSIPAWHAYLMAALDDDDDHAEKMSELLRVLPNCPPEAAWPPASNTTTSASPRRKIPLHVAVDRRHPQPALVQWLSDAAPELVHVRDAESGLLPMEMVSSHILAKEEAERYHQFHYPRTMIAMVNPSSSTSTSPSSVSSSPTSSSTATTTSSSNWECVCILALHHSQRYQHCIRPPPVAQRPPILHACLAAQMEDGNSFPLSLLERALRRYKHEALVPDEKGNLPLHIVVSPRHSVAAAAKKRYRNAHRDEHNHNKTNEEAGEDEEEDEEEEDDLPFDTERLVDQVFKLAPEAAKVMNHDHCLPLDLALASSSRKAFKLAQAYPAALGFRGRIPPQHYSLVFCELLRRAPADVAFCMLQTASNFL